MSRQAMASSPLEAALRHRRAGEFPTAEQLYRAALRQRPRDGAVHNLLGLACYQRQDYTAAAAMRRAVALRAEAEHYRNLGMVRRAQGRLDEALAAYRRAEALQPAPETHFNTGNLLAQMDRPEDAVPAFQAALRLRPAHAPSWHNLGAALIAAGREKEAVDILRTGLEQMPAVPTPFYNPGLALERLQQWQEAIEAFRAALAQDASHLEATLHLGHCLIRIEDWPGAEASFSQAISQAAEKVEGWLGLGLAMQAQERHEEAHRAFMQAVRLRPDGWDAYYHLARVLDQQGRWDDAEAATRRAQALAPNDAKALTQLGDLLMTLGMPEQALDCSERAVALAPDDPGARLACAGHRLMLGRLGEGWDLTSHRWRPEDRLHDGGLPLWNGQPLPEGRILVGREQGIGDEIMFASLLPELLAAVNHLTLLCEPRLRSVFARAFPTLAFREASDQTDGLRAQIPMGDLPRLLRPNEAAFAQARQPYLHAEPDRIASLRQRYGDGRPLVGLSWRRLNTATAARRSMTLADAAPLLADRRFRFVSLQYGDARKIAEEAKGLPILVDPDVDALASAEDALAQVAAMNLVISIDNSTVHFAGALGIDCHVLLPFAADWRWVVGREDTHWYSSLRLLRQQRGESWQQLSARLIPHLDNYAKKYACGTRGACEK
jgi:tetratricopeptide (TPR) repeat protein